jgi:DNA-binding transcriptional regulator GbsR (MarR family)
MNAYEEWIEELHRQHLLEDPLKPGLRRFYYDHTQRFYYDIDDSIEPDWINRELSEILQEEITKELNSEIIRQVSPKGEGQS